MDKELLSEEDVDDLPAEPQQQPTPGTSSGVGLSRTKRPAAVIWKFFTKVGPLEAKCQTCSCLLKIKTGSTTSMIRHLEAKHPVHYKQYVQDQKEFESQKVAKQSKLTPFFKQTKIEEMLTSKDKWPHNHPKAKLITESIVNWMAKSLHPYSMVEEKGFVDLMKVMEPKYVVPSRTTFSRSLIPDLYFKTKVNVENEIKESLEHGISSVSVTTDLWTSSANDAFLSVNAHFLDNSFNMKTKCLENAYFDEEHNGRNIASKLKLIVEDQYKIKPSQTVQIFCITDNATNKVSALSLLPNWVHLRCFAHTLQLALHDAKKDVAGMSKMLSKVRKIVGHYRHSSTAQTRLDKLQEQLGMRPLHLIQDCETRWNSEFKMLSRMIELKQPISADLVNVSNIENLTSTEWELAEGYTVILKPLDNATTTASSSSLPTLSTVLPMIDGISAVLRNFVEAGQKGVLFARALEKSIKTRFPEPSYLMNKHYLLSMALDPRYKLVILDEANKRTTIDLLKREAQHYKERYQTSYSASSACGETSTTVTSEAAQKGMANL
jgi:hypothetical protein